VPPDNVPPDNVPREAFVSDPRGGLYGSTQHLLLDAQR